MWGSGPRSPTWSVRCGPRSRSRDRAPQVEDVEALLQLVDAAETAYAQLIEEHVEFAEQMLALYAAQLAVVDAGTARDQVLDAARGRDAA